MEWILSENKIKLYESEDDRRYGDPIMVIDADHWNGVLSLNIEVRGETVHKEPIDG